MVVLRETCFKTQHKEYLVMKNHRDRCRVFCLLLMQLQHKEKVFDLAKISLLFYDTATFFHGNEEVNLITCRLIRLQQML